MATDNREIVYYKGKQYFVVRRGEVVAELENMSISTEKKIVELSAILTPEEYKVKQSKQRSQHVNWCK